MLGKPKPDDLSRRGADPQKFMTNIISLIEFTVGESSVLETFSATVGEDKD